MVAALHRAIWLHMCASLLGLLLARSLMCVSLCMCFRVFRSLCLVEIIQTSMFLSVSRFQFEAWIHAPNSFYFLRPRFISCVHACFMVALMQFAMRFWSAATCKMNSVRWIQLEWWTANSNISCGQRWSSSECSKHICDPQSDPLALIILHKRIFISASKQQRSLNFTLSLFISVLGVDLVALWRTKRCVASNSNHNDLLLCWGFF